MYQQLFKAVEQSATVLTGSKRLSRLLVERFGEHQRDRGRSIWKTPRILPWDAFLHQCWDDWTLRSGGSNRVLLSAVQEAAVWEAVIAESAEGRGLLRIPETATAAMEAWKLVHAYRLPFESGVFSINEDCEAFFKWGRDFEARLAKESWIEQARLSDVIAKLFREQRLDQPEAVLIAGIDEFTPQQQELSSAWGAVAWRPAPLFATPDLRGFRDSAEELRNAALWARAIIERNKEARIGVAVPNIAAERSRIKAIFGDLLREAFDISLGPPLTERPLVHSALLILELVRGPFEIEQMSMLLRSRFLKGADKEAMDRARLDARVRQKLQSPVSLEQVRGQTESCPLLYRTFGSLDRELRKLPAEQTPSAWSRSLSSLLNSAGWPGEGALNSEEHQTLEAWNKLLSTLSTLDSVTGRCDAGAALKRLRTLAANTPFQPENEGNPVQILGLLESSGVRFDHLWVMGLHDEQMPPPARPNPFIPIGLQRERALPQSSPERELEFNRSLMARLTASAPEVILSYPQWEGDQQRGPSPLIPGAFSMEESAPGRELWADLIHTSARSECLEDRVAPQLPLGSEQRGGTYMLRDMAACPFRAYVLHRLISKPLQDPDFGINALEKGSAVHKALSLIWEALKTHANLRGATPDELDSLITASVDQALGDSTGLGRTLERVRLRRLLTEWLELEKARPPFTFVSSEKEQQATIGGLAIKTRIDRVDQLRDGGLVIIDYKTGVVKGGAWADERPDEPQVPLYCVAAEGKVSAAAFAKIRTGDVGFQGVAENGALGRIESMREMKAPLPELIEQWDRVLNKLGKDFREGVADVAPKKPATCNYCDVTALCRVNDMPVEVDDD